MVMFVRDICERRVFESEYNGDLSTSLITCELNGDKIKVEDTRDGKS